MKHNLYFFTLFFVIPQGAPPSDVPVVDTAEQVYISSLALLKVCHTVRMLKHSIIMITIILINLSKEY